MYKVVFYEKLTSVTALRCQTYSPLYSPYEIRRASGVGVNRCHDCLSPVAGNAITVGAVSQSLNEGIDISHSIGHLSEEFIRSILTVDDVNYTSIGRGVDQGGQKNDGNGKSAVEGHRVERRVKMRQ